jgi:excisionase family DNA binding protein
MTAKNKQLTVAQAAEILGVSPSRVKQYIADGRLKAQKIREIEGIRLVTPAWKISAASVAAFIRQPVGWRKGRRRGKKKPAPAG